MDNFTQFRITWEENINEGLFWIRLTWRQSEEIVQIVLTAVELAFLKMGGNIP